MPILKITGLRAALGKMQWRRGLRAGIAIGVAMLVCHLLHKPTGWAALGALQVMVVDSGGPYRLRFSNILTIFLGGSLAAFLGVLAGESLPIAVVVTFAFCFMATIARVLSQPITASSVTVLVTYVVAVGGSTHSFSYAVISTLYFTGGALWAALVCLVLWPSDPFRPARLAIAEVYETLTDLIRLLPATQTHEGAQPFNEALARFRVRLEAAQQALASTPARMTSRTVRARSLTVVTESADLLLARLLRFAELSKPATPQSRQQLEAVAAWLLHAVAPVGPALRARPLNSGVAFAPEGSLWIDLHRTEQSLETTLRATDHTPLSAYMLTALLDTQLSLETAYEALHTLWSGYEPRRSQAGASGRNNTTPTLAEMILGTSALDALLANLTLRSVMFRHALRLASVVALDEVITRFARVNHVPVTHGYWLAMTSLIVLQPYAGETVRKSGERVAGTVAGAVIAAALAAALPNELGLIAVISVGAFFAMAFYAVDYAWYCFFLTPTIVLLTLPYLNDWHFAAVRMGMTCLGALIAVLAMLLLWPERESRQLPRLLARAASADADYLRAARSFWQQATDNSRDRLAAERAVLAPARRLCGLATNEAEETLDRTLLEHDLPLNPERTRTGQLNRAALTFTTYLRRLTQTITTLAAIGSDTAESDALVSGFSARLDAVAKSLEEHAQQQPVAEYDSDLRCEALPVEQLRRLVRQVTVLENTAAEIASITRV